MKILIISHNPITTYQSMGKTMLSLFSAFSKNELCQLYIYPTMPDVDVCESYFRITDRNVLNSFFHFGKLDSKEILSDQIDINNRTFYESKNDEKLLSRRKNTISILLRDLMWNLSNWYDKKLSKWLDDQKPDRIFVAPGEAKFLYDIALSISQKLSLPIVTYVCDEFYFIKNSNLFGERLQKRLLKAKIEKLMSNSSHLITICDELSESYKKCFSIPSTTVYTGTTYPVNINPHIKKDICGITYLGNLAYNRINSLLDVGKAIALINEETHSDYKVNVYTRFLSDEQKRKLESVSSVEYCGYVTGDDYGKVLHSSDVLLHIEAFDSDSTERVKNSISTKIADCLGSGIPLLAYAPYSIASIKYLKKFEVGFIASSFDDLVSVMFDILSQEKRMSMSRAQILVAENNHNSTCNSKKLYDIMANI